jgi:hypothetical protein
MLRATTLCMTLMLGCMPLVAGAQNATPAPAPARDMPRPDQLEPAVDTTPQPTPAPGAESAPAAPVSPAAAAPPGAAKSTAAASSAKASAASQKDVSAKSGARKAGPDTLQLGTTDITGNRELPKVLYIVPWKRSDLGDLNGRPPNSLLDEVLQPLDRDVFRRENRYYDALKPAPEAPKTDAAQGSGNNP